MNREPGGRVRQGGRAGDGRDARRSPRPRPLPSSPPPLPALLPSSLPHRPPGWLLPLRASGRRVCSGGVDCIRTPHRSARLRQLAGRRMPRPPLAQPPQSRPRVARLGRLRRTALRRTALRRTARGALSRRPLAARAAVGALPLQPAGTAARRAAPSPLRERGGRLRTARRLCGREASRRWTCPGHVQDTSTARVP